MWCPCWAAHLRSPARRWSSWCWTSWSQTGSAGTGARCLHWKCCSDDNSAQHREMQTESCGKLSKPCIITMIIQKCILNIASLAVNSSHLLLIIIAIYTSTPSKSLILSYFGVIFPQPIDVLELPSWCRAEAAVERNHSGKHLHCKCQADSVWWVADTDNTLIDITGSQWEMFEI